MKTFIQYTIFCFLFTTIVINACPHDTENIIIIQDKNSLEELLKKNTGPCLLYFYMNNCSWCSKMFPIIKNLAENNNFCENISFYKINGLQTDAQELVNTYLNTKIPGYPTMLFLYQGQIFDTQIGGTTKEVVTKKLTALLKKAEL